MNEDEKRDIANEWIERRVHYQHLSHDALVAIVVELLDERDRLVAKLAAERS